MKKKSAKSAKDTETTYHGPEQCDMFYTIFGAVEGEGRLSEVC